MRILIVSSEVHPYSKTGGLADMVGALAKSLAEGGHEVGVVTPLYRGIAAKFPAIEPFDWRMELPMGDGLVTGGVRIHEISQRLRIYFIEQPEFFERSGLYGEGGKDYADNAARFTFFAKAATHLARYLPWRPEVVHVHDWQAGLVPLLIRDGQRAGWGMAPRTCLTIHNLAYQGVFSRRDFGWTNLAADYFQINGVEFYGSWNCLKAGIVFADKITTVSPRYAREILTEEYGCGLDSELRKRSNDLIGILNGVDTDEWNPSTDPHLKNQFSRSRLAGKAREKAALQKELGLPVAGGTPLFATVSRLADQKGMDLLLGALEEMLPTGFQFALLGSGDPALQTAFTTLARRWPLQVAVRIGFDNGLAHRIEAGGDFFAMPSRFEPCGLNQMYSLIYGTIPIVRRTGGLDDSVTDAVDDVAAANGIKFSTAAVRPVSKALRKALDLYADPRVLSRYRQNAMRCDFSWGQTRAAYAQTFSRA